MSMRIVVAMSGGVDSSVAAALLKEQGADVVGITLQLWGQDVCVSSGTKLCCSVRDALDAKAVAQRLGIEHQTLELLEQFRDKVIDYFVDSYAEGLTPNPCIACNDHIKFGELMDYAKTLGAEAVATGHYAQVADEGLRRVLRRAGDPSKDQSYVLFGLTQQQLRLARFPLGGLSKREVREHARRLGLATAEKPDSQDVCFVRDRDKDGFLRRQLQSGSPSTRPDGLARDAGLRGLLDPGQVVDTRGKVVGAHQGLLGYTIGQREGVGIAFGAPMYVVGIDRSANRLIIGPKDALLAGRCRVNRLNWVSIPPPQGAVRAQVKIRSHHTPAEAVITPQPDGSCAVAFAQPQAAVTPGQAAVFYDHDVVLGGGWITQ